jgi:uncharacterized membrane protein (UPF0182 family)
VVYSDRVEWADSLDGALSLVFGTPEGDVGEGEPEGDGDGGEEPSDAPDDIATLEELIEEAESAFAEADAALRSGDLAAYQEAVEEAQRILEEIAQQYGSQAEEPNASAFRPV